MPTFIQMQFNQEQVNQIHVALSMRAFMLRGDVARMNHVKSPVELWIHYAETCESILELLPPATYISTSELELT